MAGDELDLLFRGARIYDGSGAAPFAADVGVRGDRIAAVGALASPARAVVDARGLALAPGFIDVHSHDDFAVIVEPEMPFKVLQGVTTDVVGNCGMGAAPFEPASVFANTFHPGRKLPRWEGYAGYLAAVEQAAPSLNVAVLVGHGTLRAAALAQPAGPADAKELERMRSLLREGLDAGAVGFSTGLIYEPGRHADTRELVELARAMSGSGGLYATHMRDEGTGLLASVAEALEIGERGGVPVQISHHKASGRAAWGLVRESLARIEDARARGLDASADQYPYTAGSTILAAVVQNAAPDGAEGQWQLTGEDVRIASTPNHPEFEGRTLAELCEEWGIGARAAARRLLEIEPGAWVILESMCEEDVRTVLRHPTTMIGSDGIPTGGKPHPRLWGTFPRVLGRYVRELGVLSLEEAIHRMTGFPAAKFCLGERGLIRPGAFADLVLLEPEAIADVATYADPCRAPAGVRRVYVNGTAVAVDGVHTGARPGKALRRS